MTVLDCLHRPPCPTSSCRWICAQRTLIEQAILRGVFTRDEGARLLHKYGVPITPVSKVYQGRVVDPQRKLL
jgi:hypothetical protein